MEGRQVVSERFYHYDADGNGYLDEKEVGKLAEDLHKAFHPGAAALTAKEVAEMSAVLMERIDGKGGNGNGRVEFEEFAVWYQSVLDKHRAFMARSKPVVEKPKRVRLSSAAPAAGAGAGGEDWLATFTKQFRDVGAAILPGGGGAPVPTYHAAMPKPGSARYEALREEAKSKFEHYDKDKKGWLSETDTVGLAMDLHATFRPKSAHMSDKEAEAAAGKLVKRLDTNADGGIDFEEFFPWYLRVLDHVHRWMDAHDGVDPKEKQLVAERFAHYDKDESGYLDEFELGLLAADLHGAFHPEAAPLSQEERKRMAAVLMHRMDETHGNSDGRVEFEEFFPWYLSLLMLSHVTSYHAAWAAAGSRR
jgi:Ca2+-binding EF-hand superfamily protein